jgi:AcrR family transcriptional regulator
MCIVCSVRRHGWGGELPSDDDEARQRILETARSIIRSTGAAPTIAEVANELSVSRATVYRYFTSAEALLLAAASEGIASFLDDIADRIATIPDADEVVVEGIAFTFEEIERRAELALLLEPGRTSGTNEVTSGAAVELGRSVLEATPIDWAETGYRTSESLDELARFMLRILQSLLLDPGSPPMRGDRLRAYLRRWVAPGVVGHQATLVHERAARPTPGGRRT